MTNSEIAGLVIGAAISTSTPVLFATVGETLAERSGVINLGLEGSMLMGAVSTAGVYSATNNIPLAVLAGAVAGGLFGLMHASMVVLANVSMLASGICLFFIGRGLSAFLGRSLVGVPLPGLSRLSIPYLSSVPILGNAFFRHDWLVYLALILAIATWYLIFHTQLGLAVRATGENAEVARSQGVPTVAIRMLAVTAGSAFAALGGSHIVLAFSHTWLEGITSGRGWVAIGLVVLARWNPLSVIPISWIFGVVITLQLNAQAAGLTVSPYLLATLPYIFTIGVLIVTRVWVRSSAVPAALVRSNT
ncbi:MAG: ABC transporter permease [Pyrinomonadaceae bacterium]